VPRFAPSGVHGDVFYRILDGRPEVSTAWHALSRALLGSSSTLGVELKEEVRRSIAQGIGCALCTTIGGPSRESQLESRSALAVAFAEQVIDSHGAIEDSVFDPLRKEFTEEQLIELCTWICFEFGGNVLGKLMQLPPATQDDIRSYQEYLSTVATDPNTVPDSARAKGASPKMLDRGAFESTLQFFRDQQLLSGQESDAVLELFDKEFPFAEALEVAESVHVQVKVDRIEDLPHDDIKTREIISERSAPCFQKYAFPGGIAMIFTSGAIAEEDLIPGAVTRSKPFVDHLGIDLRDESPETRALFDAIPDRALKACWRQVRQGGPGTPVFGCYSEVSEKLWVFPPEGEGGWRRPMEFAFGAIRIHTNDVGCDYRPIDPSHRLAPLAASARAMAQAWACG
jgi:hypothetical protein